MGKTNFIWINIHRPHRSFIPQGSKEGGHLHSNICRNTPQFDQLFSSLMATLSTVTVIEESLKTQLSTAWEVVIRGY